MVFTIGIGFACAATTMAGAPWPLRCTAGHRPPSRPRADYSASVTMSLRSLICTPLHPNDLHANTALARQWSQNISSLRQIMHLVLRCHDSSAAHDRFMACAVPDDPCGVSEHSTLAGGQVHDADLVGQPRIVLVCICHGRQRRVHSLSAAPLGPAQPPMGQHPLMRAQPLLFSDVPQWISGMLLYCSGTCPFSPPTGRAI